MGDVWGWIKGHPLYAVGGVVVLYLVYRHFSSSSGGTVTVPVATGASSSPSTAGTSSLNSGGGGSPGVPTGVTGTTNTPTSGTTTAPTSSAGGSTATTSGGSPTVASTGLTTNQALAQFNAGIPSYEQIYPIGGQQVSYSPTAGYNGVAASPSQQEAIGLGNLTNAQSNFIAQTNAEVNPGGIGTVSQSGQTYGLSELSPASIARIQQINAMPSGG